MDPPLTHFFKWKINRNQAILDQCREEIKGKVGTKKRNDYEKIDKEGGVAADHEVNNARNILHGSQKAIDILMSDEEIASKVDFLKEHTSEWYNEKHQTNITKESCKIDLLSLISAAPNQPSTAV